jgi:hypothetical protein
VEGGDKLEVLSRPGSRSGASCLFGLSAISIWLLVYFCRGVDQILLESDWGSRSGFVGVRLSRMLCLRACVVEFEEPLVFGSLYISVGE